METSVAQLIELLDKFAEEAFVRCAKKFGLMESGPAKTPIPATAGPTPPEANDTTTAATEPETAQPPAIDKKEPEPLATIDDIVKLHRVIKAKTRAKSWRSTFSYFAIWPPDPWNEPANAADLDRMATWFKAADCDRIIKRLDT